MCAECGGTCPKGIFNGFGGNRSKVKPLGNRNGYLPGYTDEDTQQEGKSTAIEPIGPEKAKLFFDAMQARYSRMMADQAFDHSHPVDEYAPQGGTAVIANTLTVQSDYDMPEKIESIYVVIPVGATGASLQLGQRIINLYTGAALTTPLTPYIPAPLGIILNSDDPRILTITGTVTSPPYLGLTGYALTRGQFS